MPRFYISPKLSSSQRFQCVFNPLPTSHKNKENTSKLRLTHLLHEVFLAVGELVELLGDRGDESLGQVRVTACLSVALFQHGLPRLKVTHASHDPVWVKDRQHHWSAIIGIIISQCFLTGMLWTIMRSSSFSMAKDYEYQ